MAQEKNIIDEAFPGDVIGLYDTGNFKIGDTLTEGEEFMFRGIPSFSPEIFKEVINADPMKSKQLEKGVRQLTEEGVAQLFIQYQGNRKIIGTVGELQFEVIQYRLQHEYGASANFQHLNVYKACWITYEDRAEFDAFAKYREHQIAYDKENNPVFLAESSWMLNTMIQDFPKLQFHFNSEFKTA
jgi:peptide chain release factor 3